MSIGKKVVTWDELRTELRRLKLGILTASRGGYSAAGEESESDIPSLTAGDILYANAAPELATLAAAAAGQVLVSGTVPSWSDSPTLDDLTISNPVNIYALSHDSFADYDGDEHVAHSGVTLTAGTGLTGGGDISANRTFNVDVGIADDKILQVDQVAGLTDEQIVRATANGLESRTDAQILAQLSGDATAAFDWNNQDLDNVANLPTVTTAAWSKTIGSGGDYADWATMLADMPDLIAHAVTVTIEQGTTLTEVCELKNKHGLTKDAVITIQAEKYYPTSSNSIPTADGATATTLNDTNVFDTDDEYNGCWVLIVDGTGTDNGFVPITDTTGGATNTITVASWPGTQPDNTSRYIIVGALIDCAGSRDYGFYLENDTAAIDFYGIGVDDGDVYGFRIVQCSDMGLYYCGVYGSDWSGISFGRCLSGDVRDCGIVNNNTASHFWFGGVSSQSCNYVNVQDCGISDNGEVGILAHWGGTCQAYRNFGDGNEKWGSYAQWNGVIRIVNTECSGASGNHSDTGTADTAGDDQAVVYS